MLAPTWWPGVVTVTVTDAESTDATVTPFERLKQVVEPSGAAP